MTEPWVPVLSVRESAGRCRLTLAGLAHGDGRTLQEAGDDLIDRLRSMAVRARDFGFRGSTELPPPDYRLLDFLWDLRERIASGEDIRDRVFGPAASSDTSA